MDAVLAEGRRGGGEGEGEQERGEPAGGGEGAAAAGVLCGGIRVGEIGAAGGARGGRVHHRVGGLVYEDAAQAGGLGEARGEELS